MTPGVSVASVADLSTYGLLTNIERQEQRDKMLGRFANMYGPAVGTGAVMEYLGQTGLDALKGADMLKVAPSQYSSEVEYGDSPVAKSLRDVATIHTADLGTRISLHSSTADSIPTRPRPTPTPTSGPTPPTPSPTSGTTSGPTTPTTTS